MSEGDQRVYTTTQIGEICRVAPRTAQKWYDAGFLKGEQIGGKKIRLIYRDSLVSLMKESKMPEEWLTEYDSKNS